MYQLPWPFPGRDESTLGIWATGARDDERIRSWVSLQARPRSDRCDCRTRYGGALGACRRCRTRCHTSFSSTPSRSSWGCLGLPTGPRWRRACTCTTASVSPTQSAAGNPCAHARTHATVRTYTRARAHVNAHTHAHKRARVRERERERERERARVTARARRTQVLSHVRAARTPRVNGSSVQCGTAAQCDERFDEAWLLLYQRPKPKGIGAVVGLVETFGPCAEHGGGSFARGVVCARVCARACACVRARPSVRACRSALARVCECACVCAELPRALPQLRVLTRRAADAAGRLCAGAAIVRERRQVRCAGR